MGWPRTSMRGGGVRVTLWLVSALLAAAIAGAACADRADPSAPASPAPPIASGGGGAPAPAAAAPRTIVPVALAPAFGGRVFDRPVDLLTVPGGGFYLAEQDGEILFLPAADTADARPVLDWRRAVSRAGNEEGLLSIALDPAFAENGFLYAYYAVAGDPRTRLSRLTLRDHVADPASERVLLEVAQPYRNHNGGAVRFGPDGFLYLGLGDGGSAGDPHGNGQNPRTLLGKILRLDVRAVSAAQPYAVPPDNPFVGASVDSAPRPEIWALGFRNPWRMAFDPATGALWVGDVGQDAVEEIDIVLRGGNYGWNRLEGDRCYAPPAGCDTADAVPPVATYSHAEGCSVTGGVVYRGTRLPALDGAYLFADFCSGRLWALASAAAEAAPVVMAETGVNIASFAVDAAGEVFLLAFGGPILRIVPD